MASEPKRVTFVLDLFNGEADRDLSHATLKVLLHALFLADVLYLRTHPGTPLLYYSGVRYQDEPPGAEDWNDVPTVLRLGYSDCLPLTTLVMRVDEEGRSTLVPISRVRPGDVIMGDGLSTKVLAHAVTGERPILGFELENGAVLRCSPNHRLIVHDGSESGTEVRAEDVQVGNALRSPRHLTTGGPPAWAVKKVTELPPEVCADITTDTGLFYLPETDVVVHNCEDLACWRAAELVVREGVQARPDFTYQVKQGSDGPMYLYHIVVRYPPSPGAPEGLVEDPSRILGMR